MTVAYKYHVDRLTYRFENPSSFNTPELVPHSFRQHYEGDNHWLLLQATYGPGRMRWTTDVGVTPETTARGDDYDTFL